MSGTCALSVFLRCYLRCSALHLPSLLLMLYLLLFLFTGWIWLSVCALFVAWRPWWTLWWVWVYVMGWSVCLVCCAFCFRVWRREGGTSRCVHGVGLGRIASTGAFLQGLGICVFCFCFLRVLLVCGELRGRWLRRWISCDLSPGAMSSLGRLRFRAKVFTELLGFVYRAFLSEMWVDGYRDRVGADAICSQSISVATGYVHLYVFAGVALRSGISRVGVL